MSAIATWQLLVAVTNHDAVCLRFVDDGNSGAEV